LAIGTCYKPYREIPAKFHCHLLPFKQVALDRSRARTDGVFSVICTDAEAIDACVKYAQDHRLFVEPACGAALAVLYSDRLRDLYLKEDNIMPDGLIVVKVCGGSGVNVDLLYQWKQ
jgi:L-serine/L-threonine ammonia-lyase